MMTISLYQYSISSRIIDHTSNFTSVFIFCIYFGMVKILNACSQNIVHQQDYKPRDLLQLHHVHGGQQCGHHHHDPQLPPQTIRHAPHALLGKPQLKAFNLNYIKLIEL